MLMGAGVTIAALASAATYITKTVQQTNGGVYIALALVAAILLVALPSSIISFLKLRKADLGAILEGSGWAINTRMRLTRRQRKFFTQKPLHPKAAISFRSPAFWIISLICLAAVAAALLLIRLKLI